MDEKYIEYIIYVDKFSLPKPIEYPLNNKFIKKVIIKTFKNTSIETDPTFSYHYEKLIRFILNNVEIEEDAKQIVKDELEKILNLIAFDINYVSVKGAYFKESNLTKGSRKNIHEIILNKSDPIGYKKLDNKLSKLEMYSNHYYSLYRLAIQSSDEIAKFVLLYSMLFQLTATKQSELDNYIISKEPNVKKYRSTDIRRRNKEETEYTFYRNQITHTNSNSNLLEIRGKVAELEVKLENIVKMAIEEKQT